MKSNTRRIVFASALVLGVIFWYNVLYRVLWRQEIYCFPEMSGWNGSSFSGASSFIIDRGTASLYRHLDGGDELLESNIKSYSKVVSRYYAKEGEEPDMTLTATNNFLFPYEMVVKNKAVSGYAKCELKLF